jgi:hypothetical protein
MSLLTLPVSLDTYKNLTPGFLLLSNYLLLSSDPFFLLPFIPLRWIEATAVHACALAVMACPACSLLSGAMHVWLRIGANAVVTSPTIS